MEGIIQEIINFITNPELISPTFFSIWQAFRLIFIFISILLGGMIIFLISVNGYIQARFKENFDEFVKAKPFRNVKVKIEWSDVMKNIKEGKESDRKLSIIEVDDAINDALEQLGYQGNDLREKLDKLSENIIPNIEDLKKAHKTRRDIVYDPSRGLSQEEAQGLVSIYEKTFRSLQLF